MADAPSRLTELHLEQQRVPSEQSEAAFIATAVPTKDGTRIYWKTSRRRGSTMVDRRQPILRQLVGQATYFLLTGEVVGLDPRSLGLKPPKSRGAVDAKQYRKDVYQALRKNGQLEVFVTPGETIALRGLHQLEVLDSDRVAPGRGSGRPAGAPLVRSRRAPSLRLTDRSCCIQALRELPEINMPISGHTPQEVLKFAQTLRGPQGEALSLVQAAGLCQQVVEMNPPADVHLRALRHRVRTLMYVDLEEARTALEALGSQHDALVPDLVALMWQDGAQESAVRQELSWRHTALGGRLATLRKEREPSLRLLEPLCAALNTRNHTSDGGPVGLDRLRADVHLDLARAYLSEAQDLPCSAPNPARSDHDIEAVDRHARLAQRMYTTLELDRGEHSALLLRGSVALWRARLGDQPQAQFAFVQKVVDRVLPIVSLQLGQTQLLKIRLLREQFRSGVNGGAELLGEAQFLMKEVVRMTTRLRAYRVLARALLEQARLYADMQVSSADSNDRVAVWLNVAANAYAEIGLPQMRDVIGKEVAASRSR
ncbi:hypothetical protein E5F05_04625 (plasmid) [Deinococcus metallilatus]|uniref:Uncharacterized protein n=1 Tax=Deinococcus metallilatus TaxID=1211322 RepID=A0AAJ5JZ73_9DEIO|nr:hypothetical protein [Deinococcus metallilatus]MBB5293769.1 hypothetical protein [Deinococcus metallilatus]QBY07272.1 hypothetical protein E5F05_04625 [Deinococcus metallilatus]RXJ14744.1 hypothetical protein ERJ73_03355 [Deinococcus metallilatus]TLK30864.1 hypothetical protein FCS05_03670 [Deinococcus metallilatus]GMA17698.1 hypothetical protein GCM10025871_40290 [Deinococcus metallilatus]